jgi:hypothetical protein
MRNEVIEEFISKRVGEYRTGVTVELQKGGGDREREQNKQQRRETGGQSSEEGRHIHSERNAFPRRAASRWSSRPLLQGGQAKKGGEGIWHAE